MITNYLRIAFRFMLQQKGFSVINIAGLTIGITCSALILLFIQDEFRYDNFHSDASRIYRLAFNGVLEGKPFRSAQTGTPVSQALQQEIHEIESTTRLTSWATFPVRYGSIAFTEEKMLLADSNFFSFFDFKLLEGNPDSVLQGAGKIVITESTAQRYFGYSGITGKSPVGKTMTLAQGYQVKVSGIASDPPANSHFHFTMLLSLSSWDDVKTGTWISPRVHTYIKTLPKVSIDSVTQQFDALIDKYTGKEVLALNSGEITGIKSQENELHFFVQPIRSIHLNSQLPDEIEPNGDVQYIYIFGSVAFLIMALACINFMNLSTARSASRAKEVGVRKAVGAQYGKLIFQFLLESYFYVLVSIVLSFFLIIALLPVLNLLSEKSLTISVLFYPRVIAVTIVFTLLVGLLAGSYPAFYLTQYNPIEVLKGKLRSQLRSYGVRNALVVFQFAISSILIIATFIVFLQLHYLHTASTGFEKSDVINLLHTKNLGANGAAFKSEIFRNPNFSSASYASRLPPNVDWQYVFLDADNRKEYLMYLYEMDADHLETMRYTMLKGRFFSSLNPSDTNAMIINETAALKLGIVNPIGKRFVTNYDHDGRKREIVGIMQDFNFKSFKEPVDPLAIVLGPEPNWEMAIRTLAGDRNTKIEIMRNLWNKYAPGSPFEYTYLAENFDTKHSREKRLGLASTLFSILVICIACLGLFGLATFTVEQRTKEIGIRKVMGASVRDIVVMINKDFLKPVLIANLIAWPVAGWMMYQWLQQFAFRISFPWWVLFLSSMLTLTIAFLSVSFQSHHAAVGDPIKSLRNE